MASSTIITALASAVFEWFLILLLFIDAVFSYMITKFARCSRIPIPCLLCSRMDNILGKEKAGFCQDLFCKNHKLKISSLVLCYLHQNLVHVHELCESCLFSFATVNKSNAETYRLLVGKLGDKPHGGSGRDPSHGLACCSCCDEQLISRSNNLIVFNNKPSSYDAAELHALLLAANGHDTVELKEITDVSPQNNIAFSRKDDVDLLSHVGYQTVNISSDAQSRASLSDDDSAGVATHVTKFGQEVWNDADGKENPSVVHDLSSEKIIDPSVVTEASPLDSKVNIKDVNLNSESPEATICHHQPPVWLQVEHKAPGSENAELSELIPTDDTLLSSCHSQYSFDVSEETSERRYVAELGKETVENGEAIAGMVSRITLANERLLDLKSSSSENTSQFANFMELGDAYKLAVGSRGRQLSGKLLEQISLKDSERLSDDLKFLLSQLSSARGFDLPTSDVSPRVSGNLAEYRTSDASNCMGMQILQKRVSLERNMSGISLDGSTVAEIEGESLIDRLKRQVEHDRKIVTSLYKELEEERNASAVAANQAMAMITRLQEEKSSLQMEALQCLRMMEEQAEYDNEALQKANDLLAEKEKENQDLKLDLAFYKKDSSDLRLTENTLRLGLQEQQESSSVQGNNVVGNLEMNINSFCCRRHESSSVYRRTNPESLLLDFENETSDILHCLTILERKLENFKNDKTSEDISTLDYPVDRNVCSSFLDIGETSVPQLHEPEIVQKKINFAGEEFTSQYANRKSEESDSGVDCSQNIQLDELTNEFLVLGGRLKALEAGSNFLEKAISSLNKGDGLKLIKDIACDVRELHSLGFRK